MLRAQYDSNGNIILGNLVRAMPRALPEVEETVQVHQKTWTLTEENRTEKTDERLAMKQKQPSVLHNVGTHAKKIMQDSALETGKQLQQTAVDAEKSFQKAKRSLLGIPAKTARAAKSFWNIAQSPVSLPGRKPGARQRKKITLFLIDTVRFGGTFGAIFAALFIGINYQSFWQIAQAELALGSDTTSEQALTDIAQGSSAMQSYRTSAVTDRANILAYLPAVGPYEDRLIIPKLGENVPIVRPGMDALMKEDWKQFETDIQVALKGGVVHYPGSARPGQAGNFFLTGHSSYYPWDDGKYKDVFARLHELDIGDTYAAYYGGDRHTYRVIKKYEVKPSNVSVLDQPTTKRLSTLMTCTPVGTTLRRLIIQAEEIDPVSGEVLKVGEKTAETPRDAYTRLEALPI